MRKFFENPEMMINTFDVENVVTTSDLTPSGAKSAVTDGKITFAGQTLTDAANVAAATTIINFTK